MKKIAPIMVSIITVFVLVACGGNKVDDATAEKYITKAEEIVTLLNEGNYTDVHAMFNEEMETGLPVSDMEELTPVIVQSGEFKEIDKASVEEKDGHFIVVLVAKYSEENRTYTVTFNDKDEVAGLFIK
ncbi:DUF3887 domain-containing protein [Pseudogracilibacillus sp. SO30301A]|uniref:DUF3887 domain-containing protein n=1 Tax=Pseudogracilibacillus sp. SO30301A TaxID=3098291 RepID=UPI00300E654F